MLIVSTGIGYETVKCLARRGAKVYLGARDESKATGALAKLEQEGLGPGNGQVIWFKVDYGNPRLAKKAAEEFLKRESRLDILSMQLSTYPSISSNTLTFDSQQRSAVCDIYVHAPEMFITSYLL